MLVGEWMVVMDVSLLFVNLFGPFQCGGNCVCVCVCVCVCACMHASVVHVCMHMKNKTVCVVNSTRI